MARWSTSTVRTTLPAFVGLLVDAPSFPEAACRGKDPDMWVKDNGTAQQNWLARRICRGGTGRPPCPHLEECSQWAERAKLPGMIVGWYESGRRVDRPVVAVSGQPMVKCAGLGCLAEFPLTAPGRRYCSPRCKRKTQYWRRGQ